MKRCPPFPLVAALVVVGFAVSPTRADFIVASYANNEILRYDDMTGQLIGQFGTDASSPLKGPLGMIPLTDHRLLVSSSGTNQVLQFNTVTGVPEGVFASGGGLNRPGGVISGPDGNIYVGSSGSSNFNFGVVKRYDGTTGAFLDDFITGLVGAPQALVFGPDGNLYVSYQNDEALQRLILSGDPSEFDQAPGFVEEYDGTTGKLLKRLSSKVNSTNGMVFGPDGNLYVSSHSGPAPSGVLRFDGTTGASLGTFIPVGFGSNQLQNPQGLVFGLDNNLYVADQGDQSVKKFDRTNGNFLGDVVAPNVRSGGVIIDPKGLIQPRGIALIVSPGVFPGNPLLPSPPGGPPYHFNPIAGNSGLGINQFLFVDPKVAVGYDYQALSGPNFSSVLLPTGIGDNQYELYRWNGSNYVFAQDLTGGVPYTFGAGGVDRFRILGIEKTAGLDPNSPTAFVTGLEFTGAGDADFTMTPITSDGSAVPEPASVTLFSLGLLGLAGYGWRRRRAVVA